MLSQWMTDYFSTHGCNLLDSFEVVGVFDEPAAAAACLARMSKKLAISYAISGEWNILDFIFWAHASKMQARREEGHLLNLSWWSKLTIRFVSSSPFSFNEDIRDGIVIDYHCNVIIGGNHKKLIMHYNVISRIALRY